MSTGPLNCNLAKNFTKVKYFLELGVIAGYLQHKLKDIYLTFTREGEFLRFLAPKRGNRIYEEWKFKPKVKQIYKFLRGLVKVEKKQNGLGLTNALFVTLTFDSKYDREKAWEIVSERTSLFIDKLKKALGKFVYVKVIEADSSGRPHIHLIIILGTPIQFRIDANGRGYILKQYGYLKNAINKCWKRGFVDIQALVKSSGLGYVLKYCFKASEVETTLDKLELETLEGLTEEDVKKLYLYYFVRKYRLRIFSTSRLDILYNNNSTDQGGWIRIWNVDLSPEFDKITGKFYKIWLIRAGPDYIKAIGLIEDDGLWLCEVKIKKPGVVPGVEMEPEKVRGFEAHFNFNGCLIKSQEEKKPGVVPGAVLCLVEACHDGRRFNFNDGLIKNQVRGPPSCGRLGSGVCF